jgi:hypothetical protein
MAIILQSLSTSPIDRRNQATFTPHEAMIFFEKSKIPPGAGFLSRSQLSQQGL